MTIFYNYFFDKILAKYSLKRTKLHHFFKFSRGSMPPNPPSTCSFLHITPCKCPHFSRKILNPPTRNDILDTPLNLVLYCCMACNNENNFILRLLFNIYNLTQL